MLKCLHDIVEGMTDHTSAPSVIAALKKKIVALASIVQLPFTAQSSINKLNEVVSNFHQAIQEEKTQDLLMRERSYAEHEAWRLKNNAQYDKYLEALNANIALKNMHTNQKI